MATTKQSPAPALVDTDAAALLGAASHKALTKEKRKHKNRVFAKESRERKKQHLRDLEAWVKQLEAENVALQLRKSRLQADNAAALAALTGASGMPWLLPGGCLLELLNN